MIGISVAGTVHPKREDIVVKASASAVGRPVLEIGFEAAVQLIDDKVGDHRTVTITAQERKPTTPTPAPSRIAIAACELDTLISVLVTLRGELSGRGVATSLEGASDV